MSRKGNLYFIFAILVLLVSGCATAKKRDLEIQSLRNQISVLEAQIQAKDKEIDNLKEALDEATKQKLVYSKGVSDLEVVKEVKSRPSIKQIQLALKKAGFDPGVVDGKMGRLTRNAIRAFQRANNIRADGKVGKDTWNLLRVYLYKKIK